MKRFLGGGSPIIAASRDVRANSDTIIENLYYLYLPVFIEKDKSITILDLNKEIFLPKNLKFISGLLLDAADDFENSFNDMFKAPFRYIYVSVENKIAPIGTYQKRPGWHVDGYGTHDINYIYVDHPDTTEFIDIKEREFSTDCSEALKEINQVADTISSVSKPHRVLPTALYRIGKTIHRSPIITVDGKERLFIKISFSDKKYNLLGNSINHYGLNYQWNYYPREMARNHPSRNDFDFYTGE